jgi:hypothetical protein
VNSCPMTIACVDVGAPGNVGWAVLEDEQCEHGGDPRELISRLNSALDRGPLALGFECPLYLPRRADPDSLTRCRGGEVGVYWSGGPGGGVLAAGLVQVRWILDELVRLRPATAGTTRWKEFRDGKCDLLLWEAFIASSIKLPIAPDLSAYTHAVGKLHERDAIAGVLVGHEHFREAKPVSDFASELATSLAGMQLLATGLSKDMSLLNEECLVFRCRKPQ